MGYVYNGEEYKNVSKGGSLAQLKISRKMGLVVFEDPSQTPNQNPY